MADGNRWLFERKEVRANRRHALHAIKAKWRLRLSRVGLFNDDRTVGMRAAHPAHPCGLCSTRPPQRWQPYWRREAEVELAEEAGSPVTPDLGRQKRAQVIRRDGHARWS